ncbi:MAG: polymerase PolC-type [Pseudomonadota bacterium]|jgi:DNA polymerase-3 subunit epsilon
MKPRIEPRAVWAAAALGLAVLLFLGLTAGLLASTLDEAERQGWAQWWGGVMVGRWPLLVLLWLGFVAVAAALAQQLWRHYVQPLAHMADGVDVLLSTDAIKPVVPTGAAEHRALADRINLLLEQRERLRQDMDERVRQASQGIEQERSRLAALMSELTQSVVVCNLDGYILLYNKQARLQSRALSGAVGGGVELMGLGRSIYGVFDRQLVAHALENIQERMDRGAAAPSAQFVTTTAAGQLLRVQMAPVHAVEPHSALSGFVLMMENITREFLSESARDQVLNSLTEGSRSSLANMQAALDMLDFDDLEPAMRSRFLGVIGEETRRMSQRLADLETGTTADLKTRWPMEDMLGADLLKAALRQMQSQRTVPISLAEVDAGLWLRVESFSLMQALSYLAARLVDEFDVKFLQLRLSPATLPGHEGRKAHLDLIWSGQAMSTETVMSWELDAMRQGADGSLLSVRDVVERHGGAFWFERERTRHQAFFRFLLPLASPQEPIDAATFVRNGSRPEFYDFDLFQTTAQSLELNDRLLTELTYTVFDTETTGLNPSEGDEIIQMGAMRIVNGKLLSQECFDQLVDPQRRIPAATIPIHGIEPHMVAGKPTIAQVLPSFHGFAKDTVLVAHNAAFDMRFLQLKEQATGLVFDQPVLDTLLLSAVVHPNQASHRLEAIAERFNVTVVGRHTAMGDAMVTAEVFLKLIPLLAEKGIRTLGQAREAAQKTYYARLKY